MQEKTSNNATFILNKLRTKLGLETDLSLANFLGVKPNTISTWRGRNTLDYDLIIAKCDNIDLNWLFSKNKIAEYDYKEENNSNIVNEQKIVGYPNKNNAKPPGCEICKEKDKLIASQQTTIQALQHATLSQSKYINSLEEKIVELEERLGELAEPSEKKRKVS